MRGFAITHIFADGSAMSDSKFMSSPVKVIAEANEDFIRQSNKTLDKNFLQREALQKKWQRAEERKALLIQEQIETRKKLQELEGETI